MPAAIKNLGPITITGKLYRSDKQNCNISAIEAVHDRLIVGSDEGSTIKVLKSKGSGYKLEHTIALNEAGEIDIEGIACEADTVYVIGSHAYKRPQIDPAQPYADNRQTIATILLEPQRDQLFCFPLGDRPQIQRTSLRSVIESNPILQPFSRIPSKENGVDIEGLAVRQGQLYIGFRGPVLRDNWVPVLTCKFANPVVHSELLFINLAGRGVRDLARVGDGFLVLAGPAGDGPGSYQLYFWDGQDCLPGQRNSEPTGQITLLGDIPVDANLKAEGLTLLKETDSAYQVVMVFDGAENGAPTRFKIKKQR
ncbi:MAG TPA: DUF3616 domain-containing protein [Chroococcidiopsis sp.]